MGAHKRRPVVRYHGGKWKIAKWVIEHFPPHLTYVEPFGGGASVLLQKDRSKAELYNDLDGTVVDLFRVLRNEPLAQILVHRLELTPYSRAEFDAAYEPTDDPVEAARRTIVRSFMGYGSDGTAGEYKTGFRRNVTGAAKFPATEWVTYPDALSRTVGRLKGVVIEQIDALELIPKVDAEETLFYVDPPYHPATRSAGNNRRGAGYHVYKHEMDEDDHVRLLEQLRALKGMVVLSGYPSPIYDEVLHDWHYRTRKAYADGGGERVECLWINPAAHEKMSNSVEPAQLSWENMNAENSGSHR